MAYKQMDHIGFGKASVEWAFSFAIFFLKEELEIKTGIVGQGTYLCPTKEENEVLSKPCKQA